MKTELKLLVATRFELIIIDHTLVYSGLLLKLGLDESQRDTILLKFAQRDILYFQSDLYLLLHPLVYALAQFGLWLTETHPNTLLSSLWTQWDKLTEIEVQYAQDKIKSTQLHQEKNSEAVIRKFDAIYKFVQSQAGAPRAGSSAPQDRFKR